MSVHKFATPEAIQTLLSTELNSLTLSGAAVAVSGAVDNLGGLYKYADFEIYSSATISEGDYYTVHLIEALDDTNYEDGVLSSAEALLPAAQLLGNVRLAASGFNRKILRRILLPPIKFKITFLNFCSSNLASSGNTVKMRRYNEQDV